MPLIVFITKLRILLGWLHNCNPKSDTFVQVLVHDVTGQPRALGGVLRDIARADEMPDAVAVRMEVELEPDSSDEITIVPGTEYP